MAYGENETLGIYIGSPNHEGLLGTIRNRLEYDSKIPVHRQVWDINIGRIRVQCDSFSDALGTERKITQRLGIKGAHIGEIDPQIPPTREASRLIPQSDYTVGQRLVLTIPVKHDWISGEKECIAAECEILEVKPLGSTSWWLRIKYDAGEFAALESMDGQLEVQSPVGSEAAEHDNHGGLKGYPFLHVAIRGVR